jgi:hypothetical protein
MRLCGGCNNAGLVNATPCSTHPPKWYCVKPIDCLQLESFSLEVFVWNLESLASDLGLRETGQESLCGMCAW